MKAEEITNWIVGIGIDEFQTIDKQVQFKRKLEAYLQHRVNAIKTDEDISKDANTYAESKDRLCAYTQGLRYGYIEGFTDCKEQILKQ